MNQSRTYIFKSIAILFFIAMLFSCQGRINKVRQLSAKNFNPATEETMVNAVYTDSGKVALKLRSPLVYDYSNLDFPYREAPDGIEVDIFDKDKNKSTVTADYAIAYDQTDLIDLQGNVKIVLSDSTTLSARQLYWDQKRKWVFTDQEYTLHLANGTVNHGQGFDSDENFNNFISRSNIGKHYLDEKNQ
ncbi:MAG TPA: LPS export ABC transporter periplasmic protein LptC [Flavobacteriaceae bacterium]|nr:LPS export ABC transporter periplasmic protein LptC [Flavobacteriaceae bacterium]